MAKITTTIRINNDTSNPIAVNAVISGEYNHPSGWEWNIDKILSIELVIGDKEGIDITNKILLTNPRALALLTSQIADEEDQIVDALTEGEDENVQIDQQLYNQY